MSTNGRNGAAKGASDSRRVAIYVRKSTEKGLEQEFNSLHAQREACENYVRAQAHLGWKVLPEKYDDGGFTGANLERPAFQRLMADVDAKKIDIVIVYKVDRLSRSLLDFAQVMERLNRAGAAFVSVTQNFSTADAMGRLTLNMLMSFAEFEREMIAERTRDKVGAARRRGKWTGGVVPLGYRVEGKKLYVVDHEAALVREIFALYLQNRSAASVARELNARHVMTKRHTALSGRTREGRTWTKDAVLRLLHSPIYGGFMSLGDEVHKGEHAAIVDENTYESVRASLDEHGSGLPGHGRNPEYILRGLLFCGICGRAFSPGSTRRGDKEYRYYRCTTRDKVGMDACASRPLAGPAIEKYVVEHIREVTTDGSLAAEVTASLKAKIAAREKDLRAVRERLPGEIGKLAAEAGKLVAAVRKATGLAAVEIEERHTLVAQQQARAEARLAEVERETGNIRALQVEAGWVAQALENFDVVWDVLTLENRVRLVRAVVERVEVNEAKNQVEIRLAEVGIAAGVSATANE